MSDSSIPIAHDMYGHPIYPLGETGFGVCITFYTEGSDGPAKYPHFTIFHVSDNYQQCLFSADLGMEGPQISNIFCKRIAEHFANESWPLGAPSLREGGL